MSLVADAPEPLDRVINAPGTRVYWLGFGGAIGAMALFTLIAGDLALRGIPALSIFSLVVGGATAAVAFRMPVWLPAPSSFWYSRQGIRLIYDYPGLRREVAVPWENSQLLVAERRSGLLAIEISAPGIPGTAAALVVPPSRASEFSACVQSAAFRAKSWIRI